MPYFSDCASCNSSNEPAISSIYARGTFKNFYGWSSPAAIVYKSIAVIFACFRSDTKITPCCLFPFKNYFNPNNNNNTCIRGVLIKYYDYFTLIHVSLHGSESRLAMMLFETSNVNINWIRSHIRVEVKCIRWSSSNPRSHFSVICHWSRESNDLERIIRSCFRFSNCTWLRSRCSRKKRRELPHARDDNFIRGVAFVEKMQFIRDKQFNILARNCFAVFPATRVNIPVFRSRNNNIILR